MSLNTLKLVPVADLSMSCTVGEALPISDPQRAIGGWGILGDRLVLDLASRTLVVARASGVVLDIIESGGLTLLGVDEDGEVAIFSDDLSWNYQLYTLSTGAWVDNADPDFPRFTLEEDGDAAWVVDLDTGDRYRLEELTPLKSRLPA